MIYNLFLWSHARTHIHSLLRTGAAFGIIGGNETTHSFGFGLCFRYFTLYSVGDFLFQPKSNRLLSLNFIAFSIGLRSITLRVD